MHLSRVQEKNLHLQHQVNALQQQLTVLQEYHDTNEAKKAKARQALQHQQQQQLPVRGPAFFQEMSLQGTPLSLESRANHVSQHTVHVHACVSYMCCFMWSDSEALRQEM